MARNRRGSVSSTARMCAPPALICYLIESFLESCDFARLGHGSLCVGHASSVSSAGPYIRSWRVHKRHQSSRVHCISGRCSSLLFHLHVTAPRKRRNSDPSITAPTVVAVALGVGYTREGVQSLREAHVDLHEEGRKLWQRLLPEGSHWVGSSNLLCMTLLSRYDVIVALRNLDCLQRWSLHLCSTPRGPFVSDPDTDR